jgi:hypothetical protein
MHIMTKEDTDVGSSNQGILPRASPQCCFCPLPQEWCGGRCIEGFTKHRHLVVGSSWLPGCGVVDFGSRETLLSKVYREVWKTWKTDGELTHQKPTCDWFTHIDHFAKGIYHFKKRFACILCATRCIQSFTQTLTNRDVEVIKFPSGYLSEMLTVVHMSTDGPQKAYQ